MVAGGGTTGAAGAGSADAGRGRDCGIGAAATGRTDPDEAVPKSGAGWRPFCNRIALPAIPAISAAQAVVARALPG